MSLLRVVSMHLGLWQTLTSRAHSPADFFHCAYTRYEAGLSIDEIWSNEPRATGPPAVTEEAGEYDVVDEPDEEVIFDSASSAASIDSGAHKKGDSFSDADALVGDAQTPSASTPQTSISPPSSPQRNVSAEAEAMTPSDTVVDAGGAEYEFVASATGGDGDDGSMDELEAEIAAALDD